MDTGKSGQVNREVSNGGTSSVGGYPRFHWRVKMGSVERRRGYGYNRVLIEAARILDPQFLDAVLFLTGAQVEMLRNVTQYLNRLDTYASEYNPGYYLVPTDEDFDDILEIVADLEETLMGNPNTIWGYVDRLAERFAVVVVGNGEYSRELLEVPEGYVYTVNYIGSMNDTTQAEASHRLHDGAVYYELKVVAAQPADSWMITAPVSYVLKEGDKIYCKWDDAVAGDTVYGRVWGTKMIVPT